MFDLKKSIWKKKKTLIPWRTAKVVEMKGSYISESRWDVQYLEKCTSQCLV